MRFSISKKDYFYLCSYIGFCDLFDSCPELDIGQDTWISGEVGCASAVTTGPPPETTTSQKPQNQKLVWVDSVTGVVRLGMLSTFDLAI